MVSNDVFSLSNGKQTSPRGRPQAGRESRRSKNRNHCTGVIHGDAGHAGRQHRGAGLHRLDHDLPADRWLEQDGLVERVEFARGMLSAPEPGSVCRCCCYRASRAGHSGWPPSGFSHIRSTQNRAHPARCRAMQRGRNSSGGIASYHPTTADSVRPSRCVREARAIGARKAASAAASWRHLHTERRRRVGDLRGTISRPRLLALRRASLRFLRLPPFALPRAGRSPRALLAAPAPPHQVEKARPHRHDPGTCEVRSAPHAPPTSPATDQEWASRSIRTSTRG